MSDLAQDVLVVLAVVWTTIGVVGVFRMPDLLTQLHASGIVSSAGAAFALAAAVVAVGGSAWIRALLVLVLLALTVPVAGHIIAEAADIRSRRSSDPPPDEGA